MEPTAERTTGTGTGGRLFSRRSFERLSTVTRDSLSRSSIGRGSIGRSSTGSVISSLSSLINVATATSRQPSTRFTCRFNLRRSSCANDPDASQHKVDYKGPTGTGKIIKNLGETVTTVIISNDKKLFAAGAINKRAVVCEVATGKVVAEFLTSGEITSSLFALEGKRTRLVLGTFTGMICIYHVNSQEEQHSQKAMPRGEMLTCMAIDRSYTRLAVGGKSPKVLLYELSLQTDAVSMTILYSFNCDSSGVTSLSLDGAFTKLVAGSDSKVVSIWELPKRRVFEGDPDYASMKPTHFRTVSTIHSVALNGAGDMLAVGTSEHTEIFQLTQEQPSWKLSESRSSANFFCEPLMILDCPATQGGVAFSMRSHLAIAGNHMVNVFDFQTGGTILKMERGSRARCVALSHDGTYLLVGGFDKKVLVQQLQRGANFYDYSLDPKSVCKSVHLSSSSSMLAMGLEIAGKGKVVLFDTEESRLKMAWDHSKAVWAVRFSNDAKLLAAAGWDMQLSLYSTSTYLLLQKITYASAGGPAFIWSLEWSADQQRLALGCWNQETYLYEVDESMIDGFAPSTEPEGNGQEESEASTAVKTEILAEVFRLKRADRVYAVALDRTGKHIAVGGRDKRVAMFDTERSEESAAIEAIPMWEAEADDFVYCVALSADMQYLAYGGPAKKVTVLSALSGTVLFDVRQPGVVWAVALLNTQKGWKLAIGGESHVVTVMQVDSQSDELQLPVSETVHDICMRDESIAFCNGSRSTMFGAGGAHFSWQEKPSFQVVSGIITSLLSVEDQLLYAMRLIIDRHPAVVNSRDEHGGGGSLLHFVIARTNQPVLLAMLLNADCCIALQRDHAQRSPIQLTMQKGKFRSMQLILEALINKRFSIIPQPMSIINANMRDMAYKYPIEFLSFIGAMEPQPEPEILGEIDLSNIMLSKRLLLGSNLRCPKGLWNDIINEVRVARGLEDLQDATKGRVLRRGSGGALSLTMERERKASGVRKVSDASASDVPVSRPLKKIAALWEAHKQAAADRESGRKSHSRWSRRKSHRKSERKSERKSSIEVRRDSDTSELDRSRDRNPDADAPKALSDEELDALDKVELGFSTTLQTGVEACRVPLEGFAAFAEPGGVCVLQLIVDAVSRSTEDQREDGYGAFGSTLVSILLEFKWRGFARRKYYVELVLYLIHVVIILIWNIQSQQVLDKEYSFGEMRERLRNLEPTFVTLALLWTWTTAMCMILSRLQVLQLLSVGRSYLHDPWNVLELAYVICQLSVNVLFVTHHLVPDSVFRTGETGAYNQTLVESFGRRLTGIDMPWETEFGDDGWPPMDEISSQGARLLRGSGGGGGGGGSSGGGGGGGGAGLFAAAASLYPYGAATGKRAGVYIILQALVALLTWVRLLYFFKGIPRLGTLVHTMQRIVVDIYPLLALISVVFIAFWSSIWMLIQVELEQEFSPEWHRPMSSIVKMLNMGLYTDIDAKIVSKDRDPFTLALYELYMFIVQIILLNMLIALMAESNERVRSVSKLVAQFERAKLILQWERRLFDLGVNTSFRARAVRFFSGLPTGHGRSSSQNIFPKWIHVLRPSDNRRGRLQESSSSATAATAAAVKIANEAMQHSKESSSRVSKEVAKSQEETKRLIVELQEKHGNMLRHIAGDLFSLRQTLTPNSPNTSFRSLKRQNSSQNLSPDAIQRLVRNQNSPNPTSRPSPTGRRFSQDPFQA